MDTNSEPVAMVWMRKYLIVATRGGQIICLDISKRDAVVGMFETELVEIFSIQVVKANSILLIDGENSTGGVFPAYRITTEN